MKTSVPLFLVCMLGSSLMAKAEPQAVTIPLPQGQSMQFVLVRVSESPNLFSSVEFKLGHTLNSGVNTRRTSTSVSGTVYVAERSGQGGYWAIPMARHEVTRAQYAAVMGMEAPERQDAQLPVTGITRAQVAAFLEKLNSWLYSNAEAVGTIKKLGSAKRHGTPFARLPLEAEWEFAARGGLEVEKARFESGVPYASGEELTKAEVFFSGRARRKPEPVGSTGICNPCGLFDMLGNVSEMVQDAYRPEYHFGRAGGNVNCGANFTDERGALTAYARSEAPAANSKGKAWSSVTLGFRPVLGSSINAFALSNDVMEEEWAEYLEPRNGGHLVAHPGESTTDDTVTRLEKEKADLAEQIAVLTDSVQKLRDSKGGDADQIREFGNSIREMESRIKEMQTIVNQSYVDVADAGVEMLSSSCAFSAQDIFDEWQCRVMAPWYEGEEQGRLLLESAGILKENVDGYWQTYIKGCRALCRADESIRRKSMAAKRALIAEKNPPQLPEFDLAMKYFGRYIQQGKFSQADFEEWKKTLLDIVLKSNEEKVRLILDKKSSQGSASPAM